MSLYRRWIEGWERSLTLRDRNRRMFPFEWGVEWIQSNGDSPGHPLDLLCSYAEGALRESERFFTPPPLRDWRLEGERLTFPTPTPSPYPENNRVECRFFPSKRSRAAVVVVPQWNADAGSHVGLCRALRRLGITALRLALPYHESRLPASMQRADYMVSPNIGRTLHATRQAVLEVRQMVDWLVGRGYERVGVAGTSIGSCVTYLAFAHDPRIVTGVFNHVSSYYADVVWTGLSTRYVRWGLEGFISLEDLRRCWAPVSPWFFVPRLREHPRPHLMITARYDLTFTPELARKVLERYQECGIPLESVELPCGHYTTAHFPFKYLDGWHICRYLHRHLVGG